MTAGYHANLTATDAIIQVGLLPEDSRLATLRLTNLLGEGAIQAALTQGELNALIRMLRGALHKMGR